MKTQLLRSILIICLLFLGVKKAEAATSVAVNTLTTTAGTLGLANDPLTSSQAGIAVLGFNLAATGTNTTSNITVFTFTATTAIPLGTNFSNFKLYSSTNGSYTSGSDPQVPNSTAAVSGNTITVTVTLGGFSIPKNTNKNFFLVADFALTPASSGTTIFNITSVTGPGNTSFPDNGPTYHQTPAVLGNASTTGLAPNPLNAAFTSQGILGFSVTAYASETLSSFSFTSTQPTGSIGTNFSNITLWSNTTNSIAGATQITGVTLTPAALNTKNLTISGFSDLISGTGAGVTKYYFIKADYTPPPTTATTFQLSLISAAAGATTFTYGANINGTAYNLNPPSITSAAITGGLTTPVTLTSSQNTIPVYGVALTATGAPSFTALKFTASSTISPNFTAVTLYSSANNTFDGTAAAVPGVVYSSTATVLTATLPAAQAMTNGSSLYYYLVVNYTEPTIAANINFSTTAATGATLSGTNTGPTYALTPASITTAAITTGLTTPLTLTSSQNTIPVYGVSLTAIGSPTFTALKFTASSTISPNFTAVTLYSSANNTFDGTAAAVTGVVYTNTATTITATLPAAQAMTNGSSLYYYLVVNYTEPTIAATINFTTTAATGTTISGTNTGPTYALTPASIATAAITAGLTTPLTLTSSQSTIPVYGVSLTATGSPTFTALQFTASSTISPNFTAVTLYSSANNTFDGTAAAVPGVTYSSTATVLTATLPAVQTMTNGSSLYYYLVVNYTEPTTAATINFRTSAATGATISGTNTGPTYALTPASITTAAITAGLTTPVTLTSSQNTIPVYGVSLTAIGSPTFTALKFTASSTISPNFTAVTLYSSANNTFDGTAAAVPGVVYSSTATVLTATLPAAQAMTNGSSLYYYLVVNYTEPTTAATINFSTTAATGTTISGTNTGPTYALTPASVAETQILTGLAAPTTLLVSQNNLAVYGVALKATGTVSFTTLNFGTTSSTGTNISPNYSSVTLYSSSNNAYDGTATIVPGASYSSLAATSLAVTVPTQTIADATAYYYLVVNYVEPPTTTTTYRFNGPTIPGVTLTSNAIGQNYTQTAPSIVVGAVTGGLAGSPVTGNQTNIALLGVSLKTTGNATVTSLKFTANQTISTYFSGNVSLYSSTLSSFPGVGSATLVASQAAPAATTITFNFPTTPTNQQIINNGVTMYYYIVMDANIPPAASTNFNINFTTLTGTNNTGTATGQTYVLSPAVTLATATVTGLAASLNTVSQSNIFIMGFKVTNTASETFTQFNFTATSAISPNFSGLALYAGTTNSAAAATLVSSSATVSGTSLIFSGLSQTQATGAMFYFIKAASYTAPATATTFELDCNSVANATTTFTNGAPALGTLYGVGPPIYDWTGNTSIAWTTVSNWSILGVTATTYPGQGGSTTDVVHIGTSVNFTRQPLVSSSLSAGSITFGNNNGNAITLTVTGTTITLTVTGDITQNHPTANSESTTIAGTGNLICNGNFIIGDATLPNSGSKNSTAVHSTIAHMTINGNMILNSIGRGETTPTSVNYPYFGLDNNKLTLLGQIKFTATGNPYNAGSSLNGSDLFQNLARFNMDTFTANTTFLELQNPITIPSPDPNFYVDFTNLGGNSNVTYDDPNAGDSQIVYTTATSGLGVNAYNYINLTFSGPSTKVVLGNDLTIGNTWTTNGSGAVDLSTNSPNISIENDWVNTTNVTQGGATIDVGDALTNNANTIACGSGTLTVEGNFANNAGTFQCGSGKVYYYGNYANSDTFTAGSGMVYFSGANKTFKDNSITGTKFNNVTFNGTSTNSITPSTGNFAVSSIGTLTMGNSTKLVAGATTANGAGYLTLMSDSSSTASVAAIPSNSSIGGAVNVQRFITGGAGTRGYRLISSPVNVSIAASGNLSLSYLNADASFGGKTYHGAFTEGPGTGFTLNGSTNPIIYLYDESRITNNSGFTAGKNIGIYSIASNNTVTTITSGVPGAPGQTIPVGNSYLLYYVGDNTSTNVASTRVPENATMTSTGYLNQGSGGIPVQFWNTGTSAIPYHTGTGAYLPGLNQVGNPYASTISLAKVSTDNTAISKIFWELIPGGSYVSYSTGPGNPYSDSRASNYIVSGQGFIVQAQGTGETLTFKEGEKVPYPTGLTSPFNTTTNTALLMDIPNKPASTNDIAANDIIAAAAMPVDYNVPIQPHTVVGSLHLQLTKDIYNHVQTGIYFGARYSDNFVQNEDAISISGSGAQVFLSSYSADNVNLGINQAGDYTKGKRIRLSVSVTSSGLYTMSLADLANIDTNNYDVFLIDKKLNDSLDMRRYKSYSFNINNSDTTTYGAYRFVLAIEHVPVAQYLLTSFTGKKVTTGVELDWTAENAGNYTGYTLFKKDVNGAYAALYSVQSNGGSAYSYIDQQPVIGANVYRLRQNDINGKTTFSAPITINYSSTAQTGALTIYPNPSKTIINISLTTIDKTAPNYIADIYNAAGTMIKHGSVKSNTWTEDITDYKLGAYIIHITDINGKLVGQSKFIKVN